MTRLVIDNSGRSGVVANMTVVEFMAAVFHPGTEDPARYRILVTNNKTTDQYGSAVIWVYDDLHKMMDIYLRTVRIRFTEATPQVDRAAICFVPNIFITGVNPCMANIPEGGDCDKRTNICYNSKEVPGYWHACPHARSKGSPRCPCPA